VIQGGEENPLGKHLHAGRNFDWMKNYQVVMIDDSVWPAIQVKPEFIAKRKPDKISYGCGSMIERAHGYLSNRNREAGNSQTNGSTT
jgi:hypothetical protein